MAIEKMYEKGYVFTRLGKGVMQQKRSVRINLALFELSSENRRILRKTSDLIMNPQALPLSDYNFTIGKLAKDFYDSKFGQGTMSAQKVKEMLTDPTRGNFNTLLIYSVANQSGVNAKPSGYAISYETSHILHYSYPFYDLTRAPKDTGLGMMLRAIELAQMQNKKYVYLGSLQRPADKYKLQFSGLEWFDGKKWQNDIDEVKKILASDRISRPLNI